MDNITLSIIIVVVIAFALIVLFNRNRVGILKSLWELIVSIFKFILNPTFQIILLYEVIAAFILFYYWPFKVGVGDYVYTYIYYFLMIILPLIPKISFDTQMRHLYTSQLLSNFTFASILSFIVQSFEPKLWITTLLVLFSLLKTLFEVFYEHINKKPLVALPVVTIGINIWLIYYALRGLSTHLSKYLIYNLTISFLFPCLLWLLTVPLMIILKYLVELDTTVNWLDIHWKAFFMLRFLLLRTFWLIRLHNKLNYNFDIRRVKLSGIGHKVYQVTTKHKLSQEE